MALDRNNNLKVVDDEMDILWESGTSHHGSCHLMVQQDGNFVMYTEDDTPIWSTDTHGNEGHNRLIMQEDGNLVLYNENEEPIWATNTSQ